jgi:hypothetical protein
MSAKCLRTAVRWFAVLSCVIIFCPFFSDGPGAEDMKSGCEVVSFDAFEESQAVLTPSGDYKVTARRQCANMTIRNVSGSARRLDDFLVSAVLGNGNFAEGKLESGSDDMKKPIFPSETYNSMTCFDGDSPILILNCGVE